MKILVLTQTVDKHDPMLGFFCVWLAQFSKHFSEIHTICLKEGAHDLPDNVHVYSLGKEEGKGRVTYIKRLFSYSWKLRNEYDVVFAHQNQEYPILVGWLWKLLDKKVTMWRNHFAGSLLTDIASLFCHKVFCTSKFSYTAKYEKTVLMPVGVPQDIFFIQNEITRTPKSILSFVRISPAKKIEQLIEACGVLKKKGVDFTVTICGDAIEEHKEYEKMLHKKADDLGLSGVVMFKKGIPYDEVPNLYASHEINVNQSPSGMYDKTLFEAMLCGTVVLSCNENLRGEIDDLYLFTEDDVAELAEQLEKIFHLGAEEREEHAKKMYEYAVSHHSLEFLSERLETELNNI